MHTTYLWNALGLLFLRVRMRGDVLRGVSTDASLFAHRLPRHYFCVRQMLGIAVTTQGRR